MVDGDTWHCGQEREKEKGGLQPHTIELAQSVWTLAMQWVMLPHVTANSNTVDKSLKGLDLNIALV